MHGVPLKRPSVREAQLVTTLGRASSVVALLLWNFLPFEALQASALPMFPCYVKTKLFQWAFKMRLLVLIGAVLNGCRKIICIFVLFYGFVWILFGSRLGATLVLRKAGYKIPQLNKQIKVPVLWIGLSLKEIKCVWSK